MERRRQMKQERKKEKRIISVKGKGKAKKEQLQNHHWKSVIYPVKGLHCTFLAVFSCQRGQPLKASLFSFCTIARNNAVSLLTSCCSQRCSSTESPTYTAFLSPFNTAWPQSLSVSAPEVAQPYNSLPPEWLSSLATGICNYLTLCRTCTIW